VLATGATHQKKMQPFHGNFFKIRVSVQENPIFSRQFFKMQASVQENPNFIAKAIRFYWL